MSPRTALKPTRRKASSKTAASSAAGSHADTPPSPPRLLLRHSLSSWLTSGPVLIFLLFCALQLFLAVSRSASPVRSSLYKRSLTDVSPPLHESHDEDDNYDSPAYIPYLTWYQGLSTAGQKVPFVMGLVAWMLFLFAFVGIVASDFFCPCLSTISSCLGLSESVVC